MSNCGVPTHPGKGDTKSTLEALYTPHPSHLTAHPLHQTTAVELGSIPPMLSFRAFMLVCLHTEMPKTQIHTGEWHPKDLPSSLLTRVFNPLSVLLFISPGGLSCDHPTHTKPNPEANA